MQDQSSLESEHSSSLAALRPDRLHVLDGLRGLGAVLVMLYHYFQASIPGFAPNMFIGVDAFFVGSGFFLSHAYADRLLHGMTGGEFIARRLVRMWPAMTVGLLAGTAILFAARTQGLTSYSPGQLVSGLVLNLFYIPYFNNGYILMGGRPIYAVIFPADLPLWSVFLELVVNIAFLRMLRFRLRSLVLICAFSLVTGLGFAIYRGATEGSMLLQVNSGFAVSNLLGGFPRVFYGFVLGMILNRFYRARRARGLNLLGTWRPPALLVFAFLAAILMVPFDGKGIYTFFTATVLLPVLVALATASRIRHPALLFLSEWLAVLSYPLYCVHEPVHRVFGGVMRLLHLPQQMRLAVDLASIATTFATAWCIVMFVEYPIRKPLLAGLRRLLDPSSRRRGNVATGT